MIPPDDGEGNSKSEINKKESEKFWKFLGNAYLCSINQTKLRYDGNANAT